MAKINFESPRVYQLSERLADEVWAVVLEWSVFARDTIGKQLVRSAELNAYLKSIGKVLLRDK